MENSLVLKSSFVAVSAPIILKALLIHFSLFIFIYILYQVSKNFLFFKPWFVVFLFIPVFTFLISMMKLDFIFLPIYFTTYIFHKNHIEKKYKFIKEISKTIPYSHIVNVMLEKTIIDRFLNTGTLLVYTGNDSFISGTRTISMRINGVKNPTKVRNLIIKEMRENT